MKSRGEGKNTSSNNIVSTLLKEMGGERKQVYVIGNTNVPLTIGNYNNNIYYNERIYLGSCFGSFGGYLHGIKKVL